MEHKYLLTGKEFDKLIEKKSLDYSSRKNNKYVVTLPSGKKIHFVSVKYPDYLIHQDNTRKENYLKRARNIRNRKGELTFDNPESPNFWSINLLWS